MPSATPDHYPPRNELQWKDGNECFDCGAQFSTFRRKHHCRNCGNVFCSRCTSQRIITESGKLNRACDSCYSQHINPAVDEDEVSEEEVLMSLFVSLGGLNWRNATGWVDNNSGMCPRQGVTADEAGNTTMLVLNKNELSGVLPDSFRHLRHLTKISLANNAIYGSMCKGIGSLQFLVCLQLSGNNLTGRIPGFLGNCRALQRLDLSRNLFYGSIPDEICFLIKLMWLQLDNNDISGRIPHDISKLTSLKSFSINNTSLVFIKAELINSLPKDCSILIDDPSYCALS